jgi:mRNA interferase RelE/StbE
MYELRYFTIAEKYFRKLKEKGLKAAYQTALHTISEDPYQGSMKIGDLSGIYCMDVDYRNQIKVPIID